MITEDYVSFETAKLLSKNGFGFPEDCFTYYTLHGIVCEKGRSDDVGIAPRPTLQMAMKWLREVHKIHIAVIVAYHHVPRRYEAHIMKLGNIDDFILYQQVDFASYEEACEEAIRYCLENLI